MAHPKYPYSIQGLALPILVLVLSIMAPKNTSLIPSKIFEIAINVPTIPALSPMISVKYIITNAAKSA